jgi:hypothetical protein
VLHFPIRRYIRVMISFSHPPGGGSPKTKASLRYCQHSFSQIATLALLSSRREDSDRQVIGAAMHPANPYATKKPNFAQLASRYPDFAP